MTGEPTDEELMLAYARDDLRAFDRLYARNRGPLYRFLLRSAGNRASADELFQETWVRVIGARQRYRPDARFSTWLLGIAHRLLIDQSRRSRPQSGTEAAELALAQEPAPEHEAPDQALGAFELARRVQSALAELPAEQREAFLMRAELDLGPDEIALATGVGRETAKSRLRYAVARLRERLLP
jgi:RNA polymerase sigma-70 factor (ECF subfamily)